MRKFRISAPWHSFPFACRDEHMAFSQLSAACGSQHGRVLSADNLPERHIIVETLRKAAPLIGLKPPVLTTLDAMLSCLAPKRNHHVVFASNATLTFRRNGITDRTLRRHAEALIEAGLIERRDSANRKRFTRHNSIEGTSLRFGFDLAPLFARLTEIAALAARACAEAEEVAYLRSALRATLQRHPNHVLTPDATKLLRRKTDSATLKTMIASFPSTELEGPSDAKPVDDVSSTAMSGTNGQNVRHHHNSNKELIELENQHITVSDLKAACPEATEFAVNAIHTTRDVVAHARTLAPMLGISQSSYEVAQSRFGEMGTAVTIWAILQYSNRIRSAGAYFRSLTTGSKSKDFNPFALILQLAKRRSHA
jgi:replication initiation protein RepC